MSEEKVQQSESSMSNEPSNSSITRTTSPLIIGILILCVGWLFYKVNRLEQSLASTIDTLTHVQALAENADNYAHSHNNFSDSRLKTNISEINDPLNGILSLNGVTFLWNTVEYPELQLSNEPQMGFVAQELEQIYPELVNIDEDGFKIVEYEKLIPVLVEAIKKQQLMILNLQEQVDSLKQNR